MLAFRRWGAARYPVEAQLSERLVGGYLTRDIQVSQPGLRIYPP